MAVTVDEVLVKLTADVGEYNRKVDQSAANFERRMAEVEAAGFRAGQGIRNVLSGAVAAIGALALAGVAKDALAYASSLGEVSQQIGVTTKDLQVFQYAGSQVGLTNDEVREGLTKLTRTLGEAATGSVRAQKALMLVGYSQKEVESGSIKTGDAVRKIADFLAKIPSPTQRAAVELELFGRAGQRLDTLLSGGSSAIDELSRAAEKLGIVLSDEQIQKADDTADKLESVKRVLEANIASVVADNAQSILGLASALGSLTGQIVQFLGSNPQLALSIIGGIAGGRFGGPIGAAVGAIGGAIAGQKIGMDQDNANGDLNFRMRKLKEAQMALRVARNTSQSELDLEAERGGTYRNRDDEIRMAISTLRKENDLTRKALAATQAARVKGKDAPTDPKLAASLAGLNAPAGPKGKASNADKDAEREAERAAREQARYEDALARAHDQELDALAELYGNVESRYRAEKGRIEEDRKNAIRDVAAEKGITDAQREVLLAEKEKGFVIREAIAEQNRYRGLADEAYVAQKAATDAQEEKLQSRLALARTAKERLDLERQILEVRKKAELDSLNHTLDTTPTASEEYSNALVRKRNLDSIYAQKGAQVDRQNMGPVAQYLDSLPRTAADVNEALERAAANGASRLTDELAKSVSNMIGLTGAAGEFLNELIKIVIQMAEVKAFGSGGGGGGGLGGFLGTVLGAAAGAFGGGTSGSKVSTSHKSVPKFATGGSMVLGGSPGVDTNLLSLNGRPLARVSAGETLNVSPNQRARSSGGPVIIAPQHYDLTGVVMTEDLVAALREDNRRYATAVAVASGRGAVKAAPSEVSRQQRYGG